VARIASEQVRIGWLIVAMASLAVAGCGRKEVPPSPHPIVRPAPGEEPKQITPTRFMELSASSALFSIRAAELALERSSDAATRAAAQRVLLDQRGISSQLSFAGRRLNLLPPATLLPAHQDMLGQLASAGDFDATWRTQQALVLGQSLALHRSYAVRGGSQTLRQVSEMAAPLLQRDLDEISRLSS